MERHTMSMSQKTQHNKDVNYPELIYGLNVISIQESQQLFFLRYRQADSKIHMNKNKGSRIAKIILKRKNKVEGIILLNLKTIYSPSNQDNVILKEGQTH